MGQDFHVAADLLVGYPGIYLGGFQIRMPQKTAYGLDGHTVREQHGGGVRMPGCMEKKKLYEQQIREESITQSTVYQLISLYSST